MNKSPLFQEFKKLLNSSSDLSLETSSSSSSQGNVQEVEILRTEFPSPFLSNTRTNNREDISIVIHELDAAELPVETFELPVENFELPIENFEVISPKKAFGFKIPTSWNQFNNNLVKTVFRIILSEWLSTRDLVWFSHIVHLTKVIALIFHEAQFDSALCNATDRLLFFELIANDLITYGFSSFSSAAYFEWVLNFFNTYNMLFHPFYTMEWSFYYPLTCV